ncbi:chemotaxis protein [Pampinifervens florentissimum]|uniref:chemotaxis protein n=1 Tax=Pampinifervens florentissimum TaxID=1632019 RepID=UPI0013B48D71|nr:chemotaxis protein [Hydrogenobacter sp. T-8]QID32636.1 chemotaxis protein CheV [Hydrogenobacter sp. T-8]
MDTYAMPEVLRTGANELEIVNFRVYEDRPEGLYQWILGVNVAKVREVLRLPQITRVPNMPEFLEGMAEVRGELIPVVSLARWMGIPEPPERRKYLLHLEFLREKVGVIVHDAKRIMRISWADIKKPPEILNIKLGGRITGVVDTEEGMLLILDFEGILHDMGILKIFGEMEAKELAQKETMHYTVLLAEDSAVARKIISDTLESAGHTIIACEDGLEAWEKLNELLERAKAENKNIKDFVQVVFTDIEMPRMDGLTLTKKIKETPGLMHLPVIVNTTLSDEANKQKAMSVGADAYLVKFDAKEMLELVDKAGGGKL